MLPPEKVYTKRAELADEYGFDVMQVTADGFTDEYFEVVGDYAGEDPNRSLILEENSVIRTRIYWADMATRLRARQAIEDDFRATVGDEAYAQIQALKR